MPLDQVDAVEEKDIPAIMGTPFPPVPEAEDTPAPAEATAEALSQQDSDLPPVNRRRTNLHTILNETWGASWIDDEIFEEIIKHGDPSTAKKTKTGFTFSLSSGETITWLSPTPHYNYEIVKGPKKNFNQEAAETMIALARMHGWKKMQVQGTVAQKEMLWLAVQRQNLHAREAFELRQKNEPTKDKNGKEIEFTPFEVINFHPLADSEVLRQWQAELAAHEEAKNPAPTVERVDTPEPPPLPQQAAPQEEQKPVAAAARAPNADYTRAYYPFLDPGSPEYASDDKYQKLLDRLHASEFPRQEPTQTIDPFFDPTSDDYVGPKANSLTKEFSAAAEQATNARPSAKARMNAVLQDAQAVLGKGVSSDDPFISLPAEPEPSASRFLQPEATQPPAAPPPKAPPQLKM